MENLKIAHFDFWTPVAFKNDHAPETGTSADYLWGIGSWADEFISLSQSQIVAVPEQVNIRKFSFEENREESISMTRTAIKVVCYILSLGFLPLVALALKIAFKWNLNSMTMLKENPNKFLEGKEIGKTRLTLFSGDLLVETTEAVVNAANKKLAAGGGICGEFRKYAGIGIFDECEEILQRNDWTEIETGNAVLTTAGDLRPVIKTVVHAVGPIFDENKAKKDPHYGEEQAELLADAYQSSLNLVTDPQGHAPLLSPLLEDVQPMRTIGFCAISIGIYKFPKELAASTALETVKTFIEEQPDALDEVRFVFLPKEQLIIDEFIKALNQL